MGKKASSKPLSAHLVFRESDFAGIKPEEQAQLSGSLNHLSAQLAFTRKVLQDIEQARVPKDADETGTSDTVIR
jgi:hypothetical protein